MLLKADEEGSMSSSAKPVPTATANPQPSKPSRAAQKRVLSSEDSVSASKSPRIECLQGCHF